MIDDSTLHAARPGPLAHYHANLNRLGFDHDIYQEKIVEELQQLFDQLVASYPAQRRYPTTDQSQNWPMKLTGRLQSMLGRSKSTGESTAAGIQGLYLWGGVGRGKTYLMDCFYQTLPFAEKDRIHFHRFMRDVHDRLKNLPQQSNPLNQVASAIASRTRVLCFDEFFVSDITDAMLLGNLFAGLFKRGVTVVATSNVAPDDLYKGGLQRERFLPTIAEIKKHMRVVHMPEGMDFRLRSLDAAEIYHTPLDDQAEACLQNSLHQLAHEIEPKNASVTINGREIAVRAQTDSIVWFDFAALCEGPRSPLDYLELARCYTTVLISNIPIFTAHADEATRRFINLVDVFYDHGVKLIVSAAAQPDELYRGERLAFEFQRTASRLREMQSRDYLAKEHHS